MRAKSRWHALMMRLLRVKHIVRTTGFGVMGDIEQPP